MEGIRIKEVASRKDLRNFIYLPEKVHRNDHQWLPPIYLDEWKFFNKKKNKSFGYADTLLLIAYRGKKPVGRIMGIINRKYNELTKDQHGRFGFMECYNDAKVFHSLISRIENWARQKGMQTLVGPLGFSDKDPQGFLIEGFEYPHFITSPTNFPYMVDLIDQEGYTKKLDLVNYLGEMPKEFPPVYERVLDKIEKAREFKIIEFKNKRALKPYIIPVLELMNQTFTDIYAFVPLTDKEKVDLAARYFPILDPRFVKVVAKDGGLIGFAVGIPDPSAGIRACRGRLLPFGIFKIWVASRQTKKLVMMLGGIKEKFRGQGIDVLLGAKIIQSGIDSRMESIDSHLVLEDNQSMRGEYERIGCKVVKKFRIYQKKL